MKLCVCVVTEVKRGASIYNKNEKEKGKEKQEIIESYEECVICMEEYGPGEKITMTPCHHEFHTHCLIAWLHTTPCCPLCRKMLKT